MAQTNDPMERLTVLAAALRSRLAVALFWCRFAPAAGVAAFLAGAVILAGRLLTPSWSPLFSLLLIGVALSAAAVTALLLLRRRLPERRRLLIYLDSLNSEHGGLAAAALELEPGSWRELMQVPELPKIRLAGKRLFLPAAAGAIFLAGSVFLPISVRAEEERRQLDISNETAELERKLEIIEEEKLIPEEELAVLKEELNELGEKNDAHETARTYEILEALSRKLEAIGQEAGNRSLQNLETMEMLEMTLDSLAGQAAEPKFAEAQQQMAELLQQLAAENSELSEMLRDLFGDELNDFSSQLTPEMMKQLASQTKLSAEQMEKLLEKLLDAKLVKGQCAQPGQCGENGECSSPGSCTAPADADSLAEWLENNAPGAEELMLMVLQLPGAGGVERGRGDADLNLGGRTADFSGSAKDLNLEGKLRAEDSTLVRRFDVAPEVKPEDRRGAVGGSLQGGEADIEQRTVRIHPEHREVVRRYFNTDKP